MSYSLHFVGLLFVDHTVYFRQT